MFSQPDRHKFGFTAIEALILLVVLAVLAFTSLAVYQKMTTDDAATEASSSTTAVG